MYILNITCLLTLSHSHGRQCSPCPVVHPTPPFPSLCLSQCPVLSSFLHRHYHRRQLALFLQAIPPYLQELSRCTSLVELFHGTNPLLAKQIESDDSTILEILCIGTEQRDLRNDQGKPMVWNETTHVMVRTHTGPSTPQHQSVSFKWTNFACKRQLDHQCRSKNIVGPPSIGCSHHGGRQSSFANQSKLPHCASRDPFPTHLLGCTAQQRQFFIRPRHFNALSTFRL